MNSAADAYVLWHDFKLTVARVLSKHVRERGIRLLIWEYVFSNSFRTFAIYQENLDDFECWNERKKQKYELCSRDCVTRWKSAITARGASSSPRP